MNQLSIFDIMNRDLPEPEPAAVVPKSQNKGLKKLPWGWQIKETQTTRKTVVIAYGNEIPLVCCPECGACWRYQGQKFCGGCGSEVKAMKQDKYIEWVKKIEKENMTD